MQKYINNVVNSVGLPVVGASVSVTQYPSGVAAVLYSDNGVTLISGNTVSTNTTGTFSFYAADGRYSLTVTASGIDPITVSDILLEDPADATPIVISGATHAAASKTPPVDADELPLVDSAATFTLKKLTWANLKAALLTWLQGTVFPAPGAIGATTPATGAFTTLSASGAVTSTATGTALQLGNSGVDASTYININKAGSGLNKFGIANSGVPYIWGNTSSANTYIGDQAGNLIQTITSTGVSVSGMIYSTGTGTFGTSGGYAVNIGVDGSNSGFIQAQTTGGAATNLKFYNGATANATLDPAGNFGLGAVPNAWASSIKAFDFGSTGSLYAVTDTVLANNGYVNSGAFWTYKTTAAATYLQQFNGQFRFWTATSGTAGNPITFTQAMMLDVSGNLLVNTSIFANSNNNSWMVQGSSGIAFGQHANGTASGTSYYQFNYNGSSIGSITQNGTTGVLYNTTSDYRVKADPLAVVGSGERIDALKPRKWTWKRDGTDGAGFIAHEFAIVYPSSVQGKKDEMQDVEYEVTPSVPAVVGEDGEVITPEVLAVKATRTVPKYQSMMAASPEVMADIIAELQSLRARVAALESK